MKHKTYDLSPQLMLPWHPGRTTTALRAAELLGCSQSTILRMVQDGTLEGFKLRKNRKNSTIKIVYESVLRVADEWRRETGIVPTQSTSGAAAAARRTEIRS